MDIRIVEPVEKIYEQQHKGGDFINFKQAIWIKRGTQLFNDKGNRSSVPLDEWPEDKNKNKDFGFIGTNYCQSTKQGWNEKLTNFLVKSSLLWNVFWEVNEGT